MLILVTGLPCTGKTHLSRRLSQDLNLPLITKDEIKELLFDNLGYQNRDWSKKLGSTSFEILYWSMEKVLNANSSLIVDVDFNNPLLSNEKILKLFETCPFYFMQINLITDGIVLFERFKKRSLSGERHPGHVDHQNFSEFEDNLIKGRRSPLGIGNDNLEVDTSDFSLIDYEQILQSIRDGQLLGKNQIPSLSKA